MGFFSGCLFGLFSLKAPVFILRTCIAFLFIGHGGFGAIQQKELLIQHWSALGIDADANFITFVGWAEILFGALVFFIPARPLLLGAGFWKLSTELLYPISGELNDIWEWVERSGDYFAPLALISAYLVIKNSRSQEELSPKEHG